ncbi:hypothetical protein SAMN05421823_103333 [Catalinimonas alkaloidigena]|uniref:Uncharacterized protein n=1 Tax=Catalinimonas alkaloidigena TaxID=1075417 RepID=A0A1G9E2U2_9BACT|nr:hypothetical protein [Catalinimonas alkaloidigena]SDK70441.1 hypothetical protein SAMN05421823_103333 [Catalinimonas alkaloidigena]
MQSLYLKCIYEDGLVYCKIDPIDDAEDDYVFRGIELALENGTWEKDTFELTEDELDEMYDDGFHEVERKEYEEVLEEYKTKKSR